MPQGTVTSFDSNNGFGHILPDDSKHLLFVHWTGIDMEGYRDLVAKQRVSFELGRGPRGLQAEHVVPLG